MKLTLIGISWREASPVSSDAKVATCLRLVRVIVYHQYLVIPEDVIQLHYDGQWEWAMDRILTFPLVMRKHSSKKQRRKRS